MLDPEEKGIYKQFLGEMREVNLKLDGLVSAINVLCEIVKDATEKPKGGRPKKA